MEMRTQVDRERNIRSHTVKGLISVRELKEKLAAYYRSSEYDPEMNSLWDLRDADFSSVTPAEVQSFVEMVKVHWGKGGKSKAALIVSRDLAFGLSRMYELLMSGTTSGAIMVFKEHEKAEEWLEGQQL
jgi:hypothetical protein